MRIESKLCHISENKAIVQVTGWINDQSIGSALAEGTTVEFAEDKAISRLNKRKNGVKIIEPSSNLTQVEEIKSPMKVELPKSDKIEKISINNEPNDWSNELTSIDAELKRLNWSREDEIKFLEKNLGLNSRYKITIYSDLLKYLNLLKKTENQNRSSLITRNINSLIEESDKLLKDLSWNHIQGREYLEREFNVSTRKELNDKQLISFVEKLKSIRNNYLLSKPSQADR
tara:strand:- start:105 stop:794 length:690 start_codon:yes stop_codon:yes gene_type:complete